jgi:hypothetical protein
LDEIGGENMDQNLNLLNDSAASQLSMEIFSKLEGNPHMIYHTTFEWDQMPTLKSKSGYVYVYTDHFTDDEGNEIPGIKIGNGKSYVIELPFLDEIYSKHLLDNERHITQAEREFWNNKVRCYVNNPNDETLVFTKN